MWLEWREDINCVSGIDVFAKSEFKSNLYKYNPILMCVKYVFIAILDIFTKIPIALPSLKD